MSELLGAFYLAVVALAIYLAYRAERREIERERRRYARLTRQPKRKKANDAHWREAYALVKSSLQFEDWKRWMQERGYDPLSVIERSQDSNRKP